ncbi:hypothetical protein FPV67DRAFT_1465903 [Lyophyllum atratum]|nr:hypothetical protein FPV67DRAFT_1465903 [Lyophyllum atratum]
MAPAQDLTQAMNKAREHVKNIPVPTPPPTTLEVLEMKPSLEIETHAAPLPEIPPWSPPQMQNEAMSAPFLVPGVAPGSNLGQDINIPLRDQDHTPSSPRSCDNKFGVALFPALPAPMPLRKSMRTPQDPSIGLGQLGAATPGAPPGGKRTSWLKKAREVKALEVTSKHANTVVPPVPSIPGTLKRKSGDLFMAHGMTGLEDEERRHKAAKSREGDVAPLKEEPESQCEQFVYTGQEGMLDRFKRTVEGLGARVGKSMGKSLGAGAALSALAEARAAAEARVAERHYKEEEMTRVAGPVTTLPPIDDVPPEMAAMSAEREPAERRLSVSDLFPPSDGSVKIKSKSTKSFQIPVSETQSANQNKSNGESTSTTPPDSPPPTRPTSFVLPSGPVFNKPPPVFVAPVPVSKPMPIDLAFDLPSATAFSMPGPSSSGIIPPLPISSSSKHVGYLSKQSTLESMKSDAIFDDVGYTEYSSVFGSQSQNPHQNALDEDDSWPLDEKLAAGVHWTYGGGDNAKEDSMTWSTLPSQSQRADTGTSHQDHRVTQGEEPLMRGGGIPGAELEEMAMLGTSTVSLIEPKTTRSESQMSMASSQSSHSQTGFLGQASKLLSSALGTSKKAKPEVKKVLQMAAVAAKKKRTDKKATRLRDMENRRQLAIQRKAEEEKIRALEQERKVKEEGERRKREREETTDKRPLKMVAKKDEDTSKKRKVTATEVEKKDLKKLPSKSALKSSLKQPSALSSSAAYNASVQTTASAMTAKPADPKSSKPPIVATQKGKGKAAPKQLPVPDDDLSQPSHLVQIQMAARAKAQLQAANLASEPPIASESIELPEINSEYSDSEDEDRPKSFPEWAQSPELREALQLQSTINPDDIFANWTGADRLTLEEEREYAKRMGFK